MSKFTPVSEQDLARARIDPVFRQRMLSDNMEVLLSGLKRARKSASSASGEDERIREGAQLAVQLAALIQTS